MQTPRVRSCPDYVFTSGPEAVEIYEQTGQTLDEWQRESLNDILAEDDKGLWAALEAAVEASRQNGKGEIINAVILLHLFVLNTPMIIYSAHEFKTAKESYLKIQALIKNTPALHKRVSYYHNSNEDTSIGLKNGHRLRFLTRSKGGGRGFTGDVIIFDEAYNLPRSVVAALLPTLSAKKNPQVLYFSSAGMEGEESETFRSLKDRGEENDTTLCWLSFSADPKANPDDRRVWAQANPAYGYRVTERWVEMERKTMGEAEFMRERLGIWDDSKTASLIDSDRWATMVNPDSQIFGGIAGQERKGCVSIAIDVAPDSSMASIALVGRQAVKQGGTWSVGRKLQGEIVDRRRGTGWVVDRVKDLIERWGPLEVVLDPKGSPGKLLPKFEAEGIEVTTISYSEHAQACGFFLELVMGAPDEKGRFDPNHPLDFVHLGDTHLDDAVEAGRKREVQGDAGAWLWHRRDTTDISCLVAMTLAVFSFVRSEHRKPASAGVSTAMYGYS